MSDTTPPQDPQFTPTTGLPIDQAPSDWTKLPTEGIDDPEYAAAVRGETPMEPDVPRWPFGIGALNPDTGKLELPEEELEAMRAQMDGANVKNQARIEQLMDEARAKMARNPDGVEGDVSAPPAPSLEDELLAMMGVPAGATFVGAADFVEASRVGVGRAVDDSELNRVLIAIVMEMDREGEDPVRIVRTLDPAGAAKLARDLLTQVVEVVSAAPEDTETPAEPVEGAQDADEKLDTEE